MLLRLGTSRAPGKSSQSVTKLRDCTAKNSTTDPAERDGWARRKAAWRPRRYTQIHLPQRGTEGAKTFDTNFTDWREFRRPFGSRFVTGSHAMPSFSLKEQQTREFHLPATIANDSP
jgi:hypothetical protein